MKLGETSLKFKLILYIVAGTLLVLAVSTAMTISTVTTQEEELAYKQSIEMARNYANDFNGDMEANRAIAETIAVSMGSYDSMSRDEANKMLYNLLVEHPHLLGTYVAYEPNAFDGNDELYVNSQGHDATGRFIPYWNKIDGPIMLHPLLNYDILDYYQLPKKTEKEVITEPYYYEGVFIVSYVTPIMKDGEFIGIGGVDVSLNYLDEEISEVKAFDTGYAFMTGNTGIFVSHPTNKDWIGENTLYDLEIEEVSKAADEIKEGKSGHVEIIDPDTGEEAVMFYEPIRTGNYSFVLVIPKDEMLAGVYTLSNKLLQISFVAIFFMAGISYLIALSFTRPIKEIVSDFKSISKDAVRGKLDSRAETDVEIDFKEIPMGLNEILDAVITPIRDTIRLTNALAMGKLSERSHLNVKGEFKQLANTLDSFAEMLETIIKDLSQVLTAVQKNDFSRKVQVYGEGDFLILTEGIEKTRETLSRMIDEREKIEEIRKKEIHHRIKNNLQVISSLLDLESDKFESEEVVEAFKESQNRVISMALVHEELYRSKDMESIDFSDYLMKLVNELLYSYAINKDQIKIKMNVDQIFLDMDTAIPLGMIVNEIVSNSFKHAFEPGEEGEIYVNLSLEDRKLKLLVGDNGAGFPENINFRETESLGLQLVTTLTDQIDGTIELDRSKGTKFKIILQ
ncbi:histidine kinase dimerization/phosphoacceptor domain -containing protein [Methanolobus bombayensis]|uniref:histidine kinase dimerization/phosphoacceptor domain -containing protein n=1 Tax=Methanolobus bombayensis TaxID=38023 RepID=UPI001AEA3F63|nr:histidine kinase dimerization/phosphoacceptor domain -containing protein [Methanolobus bombayensis]MBP1909582.1 two-component sensor histidine kinase [Methanolobus bombayensis]